MDACQGWLPEDIAILVITTALTAVLLSVISQLLYKYRYRVVMQLYRIKQAFSERNIARLYFEYDVFLSYCGEDSTWVQHILVPELEDLHGLKCCVHERDFPITGRLSRVICEYMEQSRYILVVISRHSMKKRWPAFELEQAQDLAIFHGKSVFYIKYGDIGNEVTPEVKQVLDSDIYIEWPEGVRNQKWVDYFFDRLVGRIRGEQMCARCSSIG